MTNEANTGLANARDVGGLRLTDGGTVRSGVLYRSDGPLAGDPPPALTPWPPTTIIDLREAAELKSLAHPMDGPDGVLHAVPLLAAASPDQLARLRPSEGGDLTTLYTSMLDFAGDQLAHVVRLVATSTGPCLVHCSAGKDRTGVVVAIMLAAVGVRRDEILHDYEQTAANMPNVLARHRSHARTVALPDDADGAAVDITRAPSGLLTTDTEAISRVLDAVEAHEDGAAGWLLAHGLTDAELAALRQRLVS